MSKKPLSFSGRRALPIWECVSDENGILIDVRQLTKIYETPAGGFTALQGIDAEVKAGEFVAVVGEMALVGDGLRMATVRSAMGNEVSVAALDLNTFNYLLEESPMLHKELAHIAEQRLIQNQIQALSALDYTVSRKLTEGLEIQTFAPGQFILRQSARGETFYIIIEGEVEIILEQSTGKAQRHVGGTERILNRLGPG